MADDQSETMRANALRSWRRRLQNEPAAAHSDAAEVIAKAKAHPFDRARYFAQLINGSAVPSDFMAGDTGFVSIA